MKAVGGAIAALCVLVCGAAVAQEPPIPAPAAEASAPEWTDPLGRFTVDFTSNGFTPVTPSADANQVYAGEHGALQRNANAPRTCAVREQRIPRVIAMDQGQANAHLYARAERDIAAGLAGQLTEYSRARVGNISLVAFRLDAGSEQQYLRMFFLARDGAVIQVSVACGGAGPLSMLDISVMQDTLNTLRFLPEAQP